MEWFRALVEVHAEFPKREYKLCIVYCKHQVESSTQLCTSLFFECLQSRKSGLISPTGSGDAIDLCISRVLNQPK